MMSLVISGSAFFITEYTAAPDMYAALPDGCMRSECPYVQKALSQPAGYHCAASMSRNHAWT